VGTAEGTKKANQYYFNALEKVGSDFHTLLFAPIEEIRKEGGELLAEGVRRMRDGDVHLEEGYDGEFGRITVFKKGEAAELGSGTLFHTALRAEEKGKCAKNSIEFDIDAFKRLQRTDAAAPAPLQEERSPGIENAQEEALSHKHGVCMVIAGPGSGKTFVLTERIVRLLKDGVPPENILALTFSNKAAEAMRARVQAKAPDAGVTISTFHSFGLSLLRKHYGSFKRTADFSIVGEREKEILAMDYFCSGKNDLMKMLSQLSDYKQGISKDNSLVSMLMGYDRCLQQNDSFDLDDLVYLPLSLFRKEPDTLTAYRAQYPCVLIDEYQDINPAQYELVRLLCGEGNPDLFVIGDPDQAIYGFRGADVRLLQKLKDDYPRAKVVTLSKSFRCPSNVLKVAGQVLARETCLNGIPSDIKVDVMECSTDNSEADLIASTIEKMIGGVRSLSMHSGIADGTESEGISSFSDFAVLCRSSEMFDPIVKALNDHGIAAQVVSTDSFLNDEPFTDVLQILRTAVFHPEQADAEIRAMIEQKTAISEMLWQMIEPTGVSEADRKRFANLGTHFGSDYPAFFERLALRRGIDDLEPGQEAVNIMTIHAAKGLEFKAVFIPGCEEGIIPFELFGEKTPEEREEEKRLLYVGITRTRKYLLLSYAKKRVFKGRLLELKKSSLLEQLEQALLNQGEQKPKKRDGQLNLFPFKEG
jgi:superfamily I DNA/RNA helicase